MRIVGNIVEVADGVLLQQNWFSICRLIVYVYNGHGDLYLQCDCGDLIGDSAS